MNAAVDAARMRPPLSRAGARLALWGLALLLVCALVVTVTAVRQLRVLASQEAQARAQLVTDALAARVQRAVALGIPLQRLEGVDALFAQRMQASRDIVALALVSDNDEQLLWVRGPADARRLPPGPRVVSRVRVDASPVASVVLVWREPDPLATLARWAPPVLAWVAAVAVLAAELLRWSWARSIQRRDQQVMAAAERIDAGDFTWRLPPQRRREFDARGSWLSAELRHVNELYLRIHRLVHSLRQTEPEAPRRAELDLALVQATAHDRFRLDAAPAALELPAGSHDARWHGVVLGTAAWLLAGATVALDQGGQVQGTALAVGGAIGLVAWSAAGAWAVHRAAGRGDLLVGYAVGLLLLGPGLVLPWCSVLGSGLLGMQDHLAAFQWALAGAGAVLLWSQMRHTRARVTHDTPAAASPAVTREPTGAA